MEVVSLAGNSWQVRNRAQWLLGQFGVVLLVLPGGQWAEVEIHRTETTRGKVMHWRLWASGLKVVDQPGERPKEYVGCSEDSVRVGDRVVIANLLHSHASTRAMGGALLGRCATVVWVRPKGYVLVQVDGDDLPAVLRGGRRWTLHVDDLLFDPEGAAARRTDFDLKTGLSRSKRGSKVIRHALMPELFGVAVCGEAVQPMLIGDWSPPFLSDASLDLPGTCSRCARFVRPPDLP
ncbi:hypothetical protein ACWDOR_36270 [Streptosporangium canum]